MCGVSGVGGPGAWALTLLAHLPLRLLLLHDDSEREFDYTAGAEDALARAKDRDWTVISIKDDWSTVFA